MHQTGQNPTFLLGDATATCLETCREEYSKDNSANCQADFLKGKNTYVVLVSAEQHSQETTRFIIFAIGLSVVSIWWTNTNSETIGPQYLGMFLS